MEYLNRVLGIKVTYQDDVPVFMPHAIDVRYRIQRVLLDGMPAFFVRPKGELEDVSTVKAHMDRIGKTQGGSAILVLDCLTFRMKEYLLRERVPFIVEGKQIYLPFLAVYLQERCDGEKKEAGAMLPSAQLLLLYYIYHGCGEQNTGKAAKSLAFSAMSMSRASRQLEEMGLIQTEKRGVQKVIFSIKTPEELFLTAKDRMRDPVKRRIYVPKSAVGDGLIRSGYSALSEYVQTDPSGVVTYASGSVSAWEKVSSNRLMSLTDQYEVELWRYDPKKLAFGGRADRLSLALTLGNDRDETIRKAVEEMLQKLWKEIGEGRIFEP